MTLVDQIKAASPGDATEIDNLVNEWLIDTACPVDGALRCSQHVPR